MKVRMSCNYNLPEHDNMESLDFQTEHAVGLFFGKLVLEVFN